MPQLKQTQTSLTAFRLQDNVLKAVDSLARAANVTRTTVFRNAVAAYLEAHGFVILDPMSSGFEQPQQSPGTEQPQQPQSNGETHEHHHHEARQQRSGQNPDPGSGSGSMV